LPSSSSTSRSSSSYSRLPSRAISIPRGSPAGQLMLIRVEGESWSSITRRTTSRAIGAEYVNSYSRPA
jgi:hypothetical protein